MTQSFNIARAVARSIVRDVPLSQGAAFSPADLFASGEDGGWYDPSDLTSMYVGRDGSGGNPSVGSNVGVVLDKSQMGGQTAAAFIAGQTEIAPDITTTADWSSASPTGVVSTDGSSLRITSNDGETTSTIHTISDANNKWYLISVTLSATSASPRFKVDNISGQSGTLINITSAGSYTRLVRSTGATLYVGLQDLEADTPGDGYAQIDALSIKEIPGNHLVAPADIQRPVLRDEIADGTSVDVSGQPELVTNGTFDTDTSWAKNNFATISGGVANLTATNDAITQTLAGLSGSWFILSFDFDRSSGTNIRISAGGSILEEFAPIDDNPSSATRLFKAGASSNDFSLRSNTFVGTIDNVSIKLVPASAARRYYLDFDGVDDCYRMGTASAQLGNEWSHVGGWKFDADRFIFSISDVNSNGFYVNTSGQTVFLSTLYLFLDAGSSGELTVPHVLTIEYDHANTVVAGRYNGGVATGSNSNTLDITLNAQGLAIGTRENDLTSQTLDGRLYGGVWIDRAITTVERENLEIYMAAKTGAVLA